MARTKKKMTQQEIDIFHENFNYMWDILGTSYYHLKSPFAKEDIMAQNIKDLDLLPSYAICSRCKNDATYVPSQDTLNRIVAFYNKNISPKINSSSQFITQRIEIGHKILDLFDERFCGEYFGYYHAPSNRENRVTLDEIRGAYLKIYKTKKALHAALITGIRTNDELFSDELQELFHNTPITPKTFENYRNARPLRKQRNYFYEGTVEFSPQSILISFQGADADRRKLILILNIESIPKDQSREYLGGLSFAMTTNDGPYDARFFKMGLIKNDATKVIAQPLTTPAVSALLKIQTMGNDLQLSSAADRVWFDYITQVENKTSDS